MKYKELFQFEPLAEPARLADAGQEDVARRLLCSFAVSSEMAARLTGQIFPLLRCDTPAASRMLLVTGPRGTGKTHLVAVLCALAGQADHVRHLAAHKAIGADVAGRVDGLACAEDVAGRFLVLRVALQPSAVPLRDTLLGQLEVFLAAKGVPYRFAAEARRRGGRPGIADMMEAFHRAFPDRGLLLAVDDLTSFLAGRAERDLVDDFDFLRHLGSAGDGLRFRIIVAATRLPGEHPAARSVGEGMRRLRGLCVEMTLGGRDASFVAAARLTRKSPEQRALVEAHLSRFAAFYDGMRERLPEFVDAFPLHPDFGVLFDRNVFAERRGALRLLSDFALAVQERELPEDMPGLVAYDSYWEMMRRNPVCRQSPEIAAVIDFSALLEERLDRTIMEPQDRAMARRLIHALSLQRLVAGDLYNWRGATPAELRDALCLYRPGIEMAPGQQPSAALLALVTRILEALRRGVNGPRITVRIHAHQYHLHFRKFRRFLTTEIVLHWVNAVPFLLLMLTGGTLLVTRCLGIELPSAAYLVATHKTCALTWLCAMSLTVLLRFRPHWANIRTMLTWGAADAVWMLQSLRSIYKRDVVIPPAGRFNTGQKINACLVLVYFAGFAATGSLMIWWPSALIPWYAHAALFFASLGSVGGHLYLALVNPSTRIALGGIFHGWAPMKYIEHHHSLSLPEARRAHARPLSVRALAEEIFFSRVEVGMLVAIILLVAVGLYVFGVGRMAPVKKQFAKNFADAIQPRRLSTKHQIGPAAESCTKCHNYAGEIPDQKCEKCHDDIRERRVAKQGYHGTLKGDCRYCHREHRDPTKSLVPLDQAEFNHDEALFRLVGRHAAIPCDDCHRKQRTKDTPGIYYIGLAHTRCTDCHRDPHAGRLTNACDACHTPRGWTGGELLFSHATGSTFPLEGRHATVECARCHKPADPGAKLASARFKGLGRACIDCHEDPHRQQFATHCTRCHSPAGWGREHLDFDHDEDSSFPLVARHASVDCVKCHKPAEAGAALGSAPFRGLRSASCVDCHQDPHRDQFGNACAGCHSPAGWDRQHLDFDHDRDSRFPLVAKHATVDCVKCHKPAGAGAPPGSAKFRGLAAASCADCHTDPHQGQFTQACTTCHPRPDTWKVGAPRFQHDRDTKFALTGKHVSLGCAQCHKPRPDGAALSSAKFAGLGTSCAVCHPVKHPDTYGSHCTACHTTAAWPKKRKVFNHGRDFGFDLVGGHLLIACSACHNPDVVGPREQKRVAAYDCNTCHQRNDPHKGQLGADCARCHTTLGWKGDDLAFDHNTMSRFRLDRDHIGVACAKCHKENRWKPLETTCSACHTKFFLENKK